MKSKLSEKAKVCITEKEEEKAQTLMLVFTSKGSVIFCAFMHNTAAECLDEEKAKENKNEGKSPRQKQIIVELMRRF